MQDKVGSRERYDGSRRGDDVLVAVERVGFEAGRRRILDGVTLGIGSGAPTFLLGPNGAGKTTLMKLLMGIDAPTEGRIAEAALGSGKGLAKALVFQRPVMLRRSAARNVAFALHAAGRDTSRQQVERLLERVRLGDHGDRPARHLSAGEQQRLALARALAREPDLLLLDEPTASLDPAAAKAVEEIVRDVAASGVKVVMATHDLGQARRLAGDVALLVAGKLVEHVGAAQFFKSPTTEAGRRFVAGDLVL